MRPDEPLAEAGREVLAQHLKKLKKNLPEAGKAGNPEAVHDARVATRRLRAGLKVLEETVYDARQTRKIRGRMRELANALAEARTNDVFLEELDNYLRNETSGEQVGLRSLRQEIETRRKAGLTHIHDVLQAKSTAKLLDKLEKFLTTPGQGLRKPPADPNEAVPFLVSHFSGSVIWRRYEEVLAYQTRLPAGIEVLHRLRVAIKRMRYTLEFFEEALPPTAADLISQLVKAQDNLGQLHDYQAAKDLIAHIGGEKPGNDDLSNYSAFRAGEAERLQNEFAGLWSDLSGPGFRQQLLTLLAGDQTQQIHFI